MEECISVFDMLKMVLAHLVLIPLDLAGVFWKSWKNLIQSVIRVKLIYTPILNRDMLLI
jgi:hypothetical protein